MSKRTGWPWICSDERRVKSSKTVAALLVLNFGLFACILAYVSQVRLGAPLQPAEAVSASSPALAPAASPAIPPSLTPDAPSAAGSRPFHWGQLESEDYKTYIARLRTIGCPEQTIRDIIIADLDKLLAPELRNAYGRRSQLKYWYPEEEEMLNDVDPNEVFQRERELDKRKREIVRELVNADLARERMKASGQEDYYERRLKFLPEQKRTQVRELFEKFDDAEQQIRGKEATEAGGLTGADREQLHSIRQQREHEVSEMLSPQEKQLYDLWLSPVANEVRHATYGMEATEQEFLTIYEASKAYDDAWGQREGDLLDPNAQLEMQQARLERDAKIRASLGDERFAAYQRGQDNDYHLLSALVTRFKLPREKAAEVYGYKVLTASYRAQIAADPSVSPQQRQDALQAISEETHKTVRGVLGPKAYHYYIRSGQAHWIDGE